MSELSTDQKELLAAVSTVASNSGVKAYLVGGIVRDLLLRQDPKDCDLDLMIDQNAIEFAHKIHEVTKGEISSFKKFYTAKIIDSPLFPSIKELDFVTARSESYPKPGSLPKVTLAPVSEDLKRRDFTINAMAVKIEDFLAWHDGKTSIEGLIRLLVDPFDGIADLQGRLIRVIHEKSFLDDPTRMFRAIRYAARIGGSLEQRSETLLREAITQSALSTISPKRKINEIWKIIAEKEPHVALEKLAHYGLLEQVFSLSTDRTQELVNEICSDLPVDIESRNRFFLKTILQDYDKEARLKIFHEFQISKKEALALEK